MADSLPVPPTAPDDREQSLLSDVIPNSADISQKPSRQPSPTAKKADPAPRKGKAAAVDEVEEEEEEDDDEAAYQDEEDDAMDVDQPAATDKSTRKAQKKAREDAFKVQRSDMEKEKLADSLKRFSYLLGQTDLFQHFINARKERDPEFAKMLEASSEENNKKGKKKAAVNNSRTRKSEKEEDEELLKEDQAETEEDEQFVFTESPTYVTGGTLRDYQIQGLNWMVGLHHNGINGILADEMGLGKTLQTISFLGYLKHYRGIPGKHLVVVPKSTLDNWQREFTKWVPGFRTVVLQGTKEDRAALIANTILAEQFDVLITSYEMCIREKAALRKLSWEYVVIDEAHRIKNADSLLSQIVRLFNSRARLLITGTPLQNNLQELWALLNFLLPDVFSSAEDFDAWFTKQSGDSDEVVKQLHKVLRPFLLRRVKADVEKSLLPKKEINIYVGMTDMQRKWYRSILEKDIDAVNGVSGGNKKEGKTRLLNIVMQLRKCCNHPYLFDGAEPGPPYTTDEHLIDNSGKMVILDKLLKSMKAKGSRVLIFSQMSRVLDILEDYCLFRDFKYCRIDGSTTHEDRIASIDEYNKEGSEKFIFLLTTRAGGLGITLNTADIVVLFDSDWNPQADLQAMDRAHRIGQKKQVYVFRFITENAVEERILERAAQKLRLDQLVIQQARQAQTKAANKDELTDMIQHGAEKIINAQESMLINDDIDEIIRSGESKTQALNEKYASLNLDDLNNFKSDSIYAGQDAKKKVGTLWIEPAKRERKTNYSVDDYYREQMRISGPKGERGPRQPRAPSQIKAPDYQFFPHRLHELQRRETAVHRRAAGYQVPLRTPAGPEETPEMLEEERKREQEEVDNAVALTEEEQAEKEELEQQGFINWTRREFQGFIRGMEQHGRDDIAGIRSVIGEANKTDDEIREYSKVFWERYKELADHERMIQRIETGEEQLAAMASKTAALKKKVQSTQYPLQQLHIQYGAQQKGKQYTEEEDRFLIVRLSFHGLGGEDTYERIKRDICDHPAFRMDWFLKSRTPQELSRRCHTLIGLIVKEQEKEAAAEDKPKGGAKGKKRNIDDVKASAMNGAGSSRSSTPQPTKSKKARVSTAA